MEKSIFRGKKWNLHSNAFVIYLVISFENVWISSFKNQNKRLLGNLHSLQVVYQFLIAMIRVEHHFNTNTALRTKWNWPLNGDFLMQYTKNIQVKFYNRNILFFYHNCHFQISTFKFAKQALNATKVSLKNFLPLQPKYSYL